MKNVKIVLLTIGLFVLIILVGSTIGIVVYRLTGRTLYSIVAIQTIFFTLSVIIMFLLSKGRLRNYGFRINLYYSILSLLVSLIVAFPLSFASTYFERCFNPQVISENFYGLIFISLFLAPVGEETLFRGLLEGYLLEKGNRGVAVMLPAILFSLMHVLPYYRAPSIYLVLLLLNAFALGVIAGYFRMKSDSLIPAFLTHVVFNLSGIVIWLLRV